MIMTTIQKIIRIGSSKGTTLPAKQLKQLGVDVGDEVEITIRRLDSPTVNSATKVAESILDRYTEDFKNLANR